MNKINFCNLFSSHIHYYLGAPEERHMSFKIIVLPNTRHDSWVEDNADYLKKEEFYGRSLQMKTFEGNIHHVKLKLCSNAAQLVPAAVSVASNKSVTGVMWFQVTLDVSLLDPAGSHSSASCQGSSR